MSERTGPWPIDPADAVRPEGREGMVTVYDHEGRYLGCMGTETWKKMLEEERRRTAPKINLAVLREYAERGSGDLYGYDLPADEILLALIEVVEAAMRVEWGPARSQESWDHLTESLGRFELTTE